jgi:hypothetical protein
MLGSQQLVVPARAAGCQGWGVSSSPLPVVVELGVRLSVLTG